MSQLFQDSQQHKISNIVILDSSVLFSLSTMFSVGLLLYMDNALNIIVVDDISDMDKYLNDETCVCIGTDKYQYSYITIIMIIILFVLIINRVYIHHLDYYFTNLQKIC